MVNVSTHLKRLIVRTAKVTAEANSNTMAAELLSLATTDWGRVSSGRFVQSTSANMNTTVFAQVAGFDPVTKAELAEEMITRAEEARAKLVAAGTASPTVEQEATEMLSVLIPRHEAESDFSQLRQTEEIPE